MRYSIEDTTLTALGDAVRGKIGETRTEYKEKEVVFIENYSSRTETKVGEILIDLPGVKYVKIKKLILNEQVGHMYWATMNSSGGQYSSNMFQFDKNNEAISSLIFATGISQFKLWANASIPSENITFSYEFSCYDENMNLIEIPYEVPNTLTPLQMAEEINGILPGPILEELIITGDCDYRFANGGWDWFINKYGHMITTKDIENAQSMFHSFKGTRIPFDLNFNTNKSYHQLANLFSLCQNLTGIPKINGAKPYTTSDMFSGCYHLRELDYESVKNIDWSYIEGQTSAYGGSRGGAFKDCWSLRSLPMEFLNHGNPVVTYSYSIYYYLFQNCYSLDEVIDLPNPHSQANWTSNSFATSFNNCSRLKNLTFALKDGAPYVCPKWTKQIIDLTQLVGYTNSYSNIINYGSGITIDKRVTDDASYQALKDDPDWWTTDINYSRYNHDSAVATINSLPDCSALGGNTIKFRGAAGAKTDGGAINTLTEEEIAVATAKGWTVSFV